MISKINILNRFLSSISGRILLFVSLPVPAGEEIWLFPYGPPSSFYWPRLRSAVRSGAGKTPFHFRFSPPNGATWLRSLAGSAAVARHALHANEFQANQYPFPALLRVPPLSYLREGGRKYGSPMRQSSRHSGHYVNTARPARLIF